MPGNVVASGSFEELRALLDKQTPELHRLLADLFAELSRRDGKAAAQTKDELAALAKQLQRLNEEKAGLNDSLAQAEDNRDRAEKNFNAERETHQKLQKRFEEQRGRLESVQKERDDLERGLVAANERLHHLENETEQARLERDRLKLRAGDTSQVERLEEDKRQLGLQIQKLQADMQALREERDRKLAELQGKLQSAESNQGGGGDAVLAPLWQRLANAKPPLVEGHIPPVVQAAERLFDGFIALVRFAHGSEQDIAPFLKRYTAYNPVLQRAWNAYTQSPGGLEETAKSTVRVQRGMPVGVLNGRLRTLKAWNWATLMASNDVIHEGFIQDELQKHLTGPLGTGADRNRKIRDYMQEGGLESYAQRIKELHGERLSIHFGHGVAQ